MLVMLAVSTTALAQGPVVLTAPSEADLGGNPESVPWNSTLTSQPVPPAGYPPPLGFPAEPQSAPYVGVPAWPGPAPTDDMYLDNCGGGVDSWRQFLGLCDPAFLFNYYDPFSTQQFAYGSVGTTPHRLGWSGYQEGVYVPSAPTHGVAGSFQATEWNGGTRYSTLLKNGLLFTWTGHSNTRYWSGPSGLAMPPYGQRFISDFQLASVDPGPWNWQIGVTPQVNSDFQRQLTNDAYMVDGRVVFLNKISPQLTLAIGAAFWNRATEHYIPYGGLIWTPDDRWEVRATFPKSRVSVYLGNAEQTDFWLYGTGEYTIDAYQIDLEDAARNKDRAEFRDYRVLLGINATRPAWSAYLEGGYITNRHVEFRGDIPGFGISDAWILRAGLGY